MLDLGRFIVNFPSRWYLLTLVSPWILALLVHQPLQALSIFEITLVFHHNGRVLTDLFRDGLNIVPDPVAGIFSARFHNLLIKIKSQQISNNISNSGITWSTDVIQRINTSKPFWNRNFLTVTRGTFGSSETCFCLVSTTTCSCSLSTVLTVNHSSSTPS